MVHHLDTKYSNFWNKYCLQGLQHDLISLHVLLLCNIRNELYFLGAKRPYEFIYQFLHDMAHFIFHYMGHQSKAEMKFTLIS